MKKDQWLILFLVGVLLLVIALPMDCGNSESRKKQENRDLVTGEKEENIYTESVSESYGREMERQLEDTLSQMEGVGNVRVMIAFQDTGEVIVEKDVKYSAQEQVTEEDAGKIITNDQTESEETTVYDSDDKSGSPFVRKKKLPVIKGILIVAEGAGEKAVISNISEAVEALFGLEPHKIKVVEMNQIQEGSE